MASKANRGKQFENKLRDDWKRTMGPSIIRLPDAVSGYFGSKNISDFLAYQYPEFFLLEAKSVHGNTLPFANLRQYDKLLEHVDLKGEHPGVVIWFVDHDKVIFVPVKSITQMKLDDKKSINIKMLGTDEYYMVEIPSIKKRVFMDSDYSVLMNLKEGY